VLENLLKLSGGVRTLPCGQVGFAVGLQRLRSCGSPRQALRN
jgi:hypothetical protein